MWLLELHLDLSLKWYVLFVLRCCYSLLKIILSITPIFFLTFSGIFELNFMASQPASGYYHFTIAVTGDSRLVANHVEVRLWVFFFFPLI